MSEQGRLCVNANAEGRRVPVGLLGDLPNVAGGISKACRPDAPGSVHRSVQQLYAAPFELLERRIDVIDAERELEPHASIAAGHQGRFDQPWSFRGLQEIDQGGAELEHRRVSVLVMDR